MMLKLGLHGRGMAAFVVAAGLETEEAGDCAEGGGGGFAVVVVVMAVGVLLLAGRGLGGRGRGSVEAGEVSVKVGAGWVGGIRWLLL